ncbi:SIR2 family protein [Agrobacterium tumefaciens]|nr:SIR2 family protein [Agrobacterium tumefaciens]
MADLRQVLSQGRKRIGLLVGAGAPLSVRIDEKGNLDSNGTPLIPGVDALTEKVFGDFVGEEKIAIDAIRASLPKNGNIETVLSKIRLMQTALGSVKVNGLDAEGYKTLGAQVCERIGKIVGAKLPDSRTAFHELVGWIAGAQRPHSVELFTTNYDLLFETALEAARVPYFDGFSGGHAPFFDPVTVAGDDLPARWVRLWKMHGSLGWMVEDGRVVRTGSYDSTELIYPDHLKYDLTQKQPYASLFERLKRFLTTPDTLLLTTGFSFRDAHICAVIDEALAVNANTSVFAFQYLDLESEEPACKLAYDRPNVSVYASDGAVINGVAGKWRPGDPPKNWSEIRSSFWGQRWGEGDPVFLLGDFTAFCRFLAISYSADVVQPSQAGIEEQN